LGGLGGARRVMVGSPWVAVLPIHAVTLPFLRVAPRMPISQPITVILARFADLLAHGLRAVLETDATLDIVADDVQQSRIEVILRAHHPRVAILDVDALPNLAHVRQLSREHPNTRLVLFAANPTAAECAQLLAYGASACLGKDTQARDVLTAIHLASRGIQLVPRESTDALAPLAGSQLLTQREAEVLPMLQQGHSNAQIALELHIGVETVRTHARNIFRKLGVTSRRELLALPRPAVGDPAAVPPPSARRRAIAASTRQRRPGTIHK
jgi:DNA-binding NarL/FixJ family response regulator